MKKQEICRFLRFLSEAPDYDDLEFQLNVNSSKQFPAQKKATVKSIVSSWFAPKVDKRTQLLQAHEPHKFEPIRKQETGSYSAEEWIIILSFCVGKDN